MFCENCGKQLPEDAKFCVNCGTKAEAAGTASTAQEETAAAAADVAEAEAVSSAEKAGPDTAQASDQQTAPSGVPQAEAVQPEAQTGPGKQTNEAAIAQPLSEPVQQPSSRPEAQKLPAAQNNVPKESIIVERIEPLSFWKFFGILLLQSIPVVNIIMLLVWSFTNSFNRNTKNYARAAFILGLIKFIAIVVIFILNFGFIMELLDSFGYTFDFGW
ncbi:MAG TPA: zinc-ribbon domain-containing protein [Clostridiales bacterium]|nr:zinc-ribbon domain-containing protein [Clostridiales bacterium]